MKSRTRLAIVATLAGALLVPTASLGDTFAIRARRCDTAQGFCWKPSFRHITKGDRIRWRNPTNVAHTVTAYGGGWSKDVTVSPGEGSAKKFRRTGAFEFRCRFHSTLSNGDCNGMCGTIHVTN